MRYTVRHTATLAAPNADWDRPQWQQANTLEVANFPWEDSGHHPRTQARLLYTNTALAIIFRVEDHYVRAVAEKFQDNVCTDSCVEFFVSPRADSLAYFNFEVNCGGTMLLHSCPDPKKPDPGKASNVSDADGDTIQIAHSLPKIVEPEITEPTTWTVEYHLPFALFVSYLNAENPTPGSQWRANFYKCADKTSHPHWGSWAPVEVPRPNFHQPTFFQPIAFTD
jgi:hypothetical protein